MNELFKNEMKTILKDEYDDFIQSLQKPPVKAFYLNPFKKGLSTLFQSGCYFSSSSCTRWILF